MSEITPTQPTPDEIAKKATAWSNFGVIITNSEFQFQARAQAIIAKLKKPTKPSELKEAEESLKAVKQEMQKLVEDRKGITTRFDSVASRLMAPEKLIASALPEIERAMLAVKKAEQEELNKARYKNDELKSIREQYLNLIVKMDKEYRDKISAQVSKAFEYALGAGDVKMDGLPAFLDKVKVAKGFNEIDFTYDRPEIALKYATKEEVINIWKEVDKTILPGKDYLAIYHKALSDQFEFYSAALKNKEGAIKLQKENAEREEAKRKQEAEAHEVANKLSAIATTTAEIVSATKPLKEYYEVDMEDTEANAIKIIAAFVGNFELCRGGVRVKSLLKISVEQMASALAWVKNRDDKFECGVKFIKKEKI